MRKGGRLGPRATKRRGVVMLRSGAHRSRFLVDLGKGDDGVERNCDGPESGFLDNNGATVQGLLDFNILKL